MPGAVLFKPDGSLQNVDYHEALASIAGHPGPVVFNIHKDGVSNLTKQVKLIPSDASHIGIIFKDGASDLNPGATALQKQRCLVKFDVVGDALIYKAEGKPYAGGFKRLCDPLLLDLDDTMLKDLICKAESNTRRRGSVALDAAAASGPTKAESNTSGPMKVGSKTSGPMKRRGSVALDAAAASEPLDAAAASGPRRKMARREPPQPRRPNPNGATDKEMVTAVLAAMFKNMKKK